MALGLGLRRQHRSDTPARRSAVGGLRAALAADPQFRGARIVAESEALAHIERACRQPVARGFSLFELFSFHATFYRWVTIPFRLGFPNT